jgi:hypothetical protein
MRHNRAFSDSMWAFVQSQLKGNKVKDLLFIIFNQSKSVVTHKIKLI